MKNIRAVVRLFVFVIITLFYFFQIVIANIFSGGGQINYEWSARMKHKWGKAVCAISGIRVYVKGEIPEPPFFMVSNHLSYTDVWVLFSQLRCTFIAKSDVKDWPFIGKILQHSGILFVDRSRKSDVTRVIDEISENLNHSQGIVLFPEGTTSPGVEILPFKSSLFQFPAQIKLPVTCSVIGYLTPDGEVPAYKSICWWDDTPFFVHFFNLLKMKEFSATITFSSTKITSNDRKELAILAESTVKESFEPVIDPEIYAEENISN